MTEGRITRPGQTAGGGSKTFAQLNTLSKLIQGTFLESFDALVVEDSGAVTMTLEQAGGGDLTMVFSDGYTTLDCTPILSVPLTEGVDENNPKKNYVYILQSAKILAVSTTGYPAAEHIKVGFFFIQTAVEVAANGALINQNINDHAASTSGAGVGQGHLTHIAERLRRLGAIWISGCEGVATQDGNDLWVSMSAGVVSQAHPHDFPALDSDTAGAGDTIDVVNDPDGAYTSINSLNEITKLSDGTAIGVNKYVKFNLWAVSNKSGTYSPMMLDLPSGQYNSASAADIDVEGHADFSMPPEFTLESTTGFLVASFVCKHTASGMEIQITIDQRGKTPSTAGGAGTGGGDVTAAAVIPDNEIVTGDGGAKGVKGAPGVTIDGAGQMDGLSVMKVSTSVETPAFLGGTGAGDDISIVPTLHATKGRILLGSVPTQSVYDDTLGALGLNNTDPAGIHPGNVLLDIRQEGDRAGIGLYTFHNTLASRGSTFFGSRARGTEDTPLVVEDGDRIFAFGAVGYDGAAWRNRAQIAFEVDGTPASNSMPISIQFRTGASAAVPRFTIGSDGNMLVDTDLKMMYRDSELSISSRADGILNLDSDTEIEITSPRIELGASDITILSDDGINYNAQSDVDHDLITVIVTGTPKLWWDETEDEFAITKHLNVAGGFSGTFVNGDADTVTVRDGIITGVA